MKNINVQDLFERQVLNILGANILSGDILSGDKSLDDLVFNYTLLSEVLKEYGVTKCKELGPRNYKPFLQDLRKRAK